MKKYINLAELNFLLIFSGFALFTTFIQNSAASVVYRAFALLIALLCLIKYGKTKIKNGPLLTVFLTLYILMVVGCLWDLYIGTYHNTSYIASRRLATSFVLGVTFFPVMAFYYGFNYIRWEKTLVYLFFVLFFILALGQIRGFADEASGRGGLNSHLGTLGLGGLGVYMTILSATLLKERKELKILYISGLLLGLLSILRAASRGSFVGILFALSFFFFSGRKVTKGFMAIFVVLMIFMESWSYKLLETFSPVLYDRMVYTIEERDTGGRDVLFEQAVQSIKDNPILGSSSITLEPNAISSCHNIYLDTTVELGVLGGFAFIVINIVLLSWCLRGNSKTSHLSLILPFFASYFMYNIIRGLSGLSLSTCPDVVVSYIGILLIRQNINNKSKILDNYE